MHYLPSSSTHTHTHTHTHTCQRHHCQQKTNTESTRPAPSPSPWETSSPRSDGNGEALDLLQESAHMGGLTAHLASLSPRPGSAEMMCGWDSKGDAGGGTGGERRAGGGIAAAAALSLGGRPEDG